MNGLIPPHGVAAAPILVTDTITILSVAHTGMVVVSASHGGASSAQFALRVPLTGVIFNDAGIGCDSAGIRGLFDLEQLGIAAAAVSHWSAEIGSGGDTWRNGIVSFANKPAKNRGAVAGMPTAEAARILAQTTASSPDAGSAAPVLARRPVEVSGIPVVLLDSVSMLEVADIGATIVSGSHGGKISATFASLYRPRLVVFNDAGFGRNDAGIACLAELDEAGLAALAVAHDTGRIGDPTHMLGHGILSAVNAQAHAMGFRTGLQLGAALERVGPAPTRPSRADK